MIILLIWSAVLVAAIALYFRQTYSRFSKHGVKNIKPMPLIGNMNKLIFRQHNIGDEFDLIYNKFKGERFAGRYEFIRPMLVIRDLELVKKITIKDFEHFLDHRVLSDAKIEPLFTRNLFSLRGQEWKDMRSTLSPAFTSSKIKLMVPFMEEVGEQMIRALKRKIKESATGSIDIECKDLTSRYTVDVIATCAFGLKIDSYAEEENKFYKMGINAASFKLRQMLLFLASAAFPAITKRLKYTFFSDATKNFFLELVLSTMKDREARNIIRPDMIHLLMEAKKGQLVHDDKAGKDNLKDTGFATVEESSLGKKHIDRAWSDLDLTAQAVAFFVAGFDTISTAVSFGLHELAVNPEIQERLVQEIKENNAKNNGKVNFSSIQSMTYLDMVISEILRLWPPALTLDRMCVKDYNMGKPNDKATEDYIIKNGESISIPVWCFHRDPEFFPDPLKFDPERFSEENKHKINSIAYMPFGLGPRNCIGSRFALCELKVLLYQLLLNIEVSPSEKTCLPAKLAADSFSPSMEGGHWLKFKIRN